MTRRLSLAAAGLAAAVAIAGCGGSSSSSGSSSSGSASSSGSSSSGTSSSSGGGGHTLDLSADPSGKLAFDTKTLTAKAGKVTIDFTNQSSVPHAVKIQGHSSKVVTNGKSTLTVDLKPGTYTFFCPVDGHRAAGMQGTLTVK